eukprot:TRINITY_DN1692_c0_g1_i7.p1 TRINITY_DN1692_c0_g1~~TRINITY_DN1692_c0_g1_i7.p1  ORF type:complete len:646 (-),score=127.17 TRINITY_DN1692_c0_g1_i7:1979-3916(-)
MSFLSRPLLSSSLPFPLFPSHSLSFPPLPSSSLFHPLPIPSPLSIFLPFLLPPSLPSLLPFPPIPSSSLHHPLSIPSPFPLPLSLPQQNTMDPELLSSSDSSDDDDVILDTRYNIESVELSSDDDTDTDSDSDQEQQQQQPQQQTDLGLETTTSQSSVITSANSTSTHSGLNTDHSSGSDTSNSSTSNTNTNTNNTVNVSILRGGVAVTDLKRMNSTGTDSSGDEEIGEYNKQRIVGTDSLSSRSDSRTGKDGKSVLTDLFSPEISVEASNNDSNPEMSLQQEKQDTQDTSETPENQAANPLSVSTERFTTINSMESPGSPRSQATPTGRSTPQSPSINTTNVLSIPSPTQGNAEQTSTSSSTNLLSSPRRNSEMLQSPRGNKSPLTQRRSSNSESSSGSASVGSSTPLSPSLVEKGLLGETLGGQNDSRARGKSWAVQGMRTKSNIGPSARGSLNREETMTEDHDDIDEYDIQSMTNVLASLVDGGDIDHLDIDLDCVEETVQTLPLRVKTADELVDILDPSIESLSAFNNVDTENTITTAELHDEPAKFHLSELTQTVLSEGFDKMPFEIQVREQKNCFFPFFLFFFRPVNQTHWWLLLTQRVGLWPYSCMYSNFWTTIVLPAPFQRCAKRGMCSTRISRYGL